MVIRIMRNLLIVGGTFDIGGGKSSGYLSKLASELDSSASFMQVVNGGSYDELVSICNSMKDVSHLMWFADVPNDFSKLLPEILKKNPHIILIQSKNNRQNKYSAPELFTRMHASGAEFLVEFTNTDTGQLATSVLTIAGNTLISKTPHVYELAQCLNTEFNRLDRLQAPILDDLDVPVNEHPGAFGFVRKHHVHEGVDLYSREFNLVMAIEDGIVVGVHPFTGESAGSPWWNETICIMVEGASGVINYGELTVKDTDKLLKVGDEVVASQNIGLMGTVLKKDKGRPMTMLHVERYVNGTTKPIKEWPLGTTQPSCLLNPTSLLLKVLENEHNLHYW